jgi:hypothetical protein
MTKAFSKAPLTIACPRFGIPPLPPAQFADRLNEIPTETERMEMAILSCMVALGRKAKCKFLPLTRMLSMQTKDRCLVLASTNGVISIFEAFEENGEVKIRS